MPTKQTLRLKNGLLFANEFTRVVHGGRGDYIEFTFEQIKLSLYNKFNNTVKEEEAPFYYIWLYPEGSPSTKVYKQLKTVKYADYKIGLYYVAPDQFQNFQDPLRLF